MSLLPTLLLVDDLAANRDTLAELLGPEHYVMVQAASGAEALARAAENPPDLVLLDVLMPAMDGLEVCRRLRADARLAEVPIILLTALDDRPSRLAGLEAGADDFISKPFDPAELCARVRTITRLNRHRRLAEERDQLQWVVEPAVDGYVRINAADEIRFSNAQARLWLGLAPDRANARRETFLATARLTYLGQPAESWQDWPALPGPAAVVPRLLVRPETARAPALFLEVTVHGDSGGQLLRLRDVTERLGLTRDQRSFQTMVSHKLRTPLNGVLGPLELLAAGSAGLSPDEIAGLTAMAHQGAERLNTAVEGVLRFTELSQRLPGGGRFELVGFADLVRSVAEALALTEVRVALTGEARAQGIPWSRDALEWVLFELLENARKFHPRHTPRVSVEARVEETGALLVTFSDNGVTLSSEQLAEIGRPFTQGEKCFSGEVPGMGLGLASVFTLVWQAGGSCRMGNRADGPGVWTEVRWPQAPDGPRALGRTMG